LLATEDLSLAFGGLSVLRSVSLTVRGGEVLGLIGPNGAGKTAFLNCISGVFRISRAGTISLNGQRIDHLPTARRRRLGIARTFQHAHLVPEMTALENVMLGLASSFSGGLLSFLARPVRSIAEERRFRGLAAEALASCGAADYAAVRAGNLPLGIRRRVDLARALVGEPKLLLLDEPSSGLSHEERELIPELVEIMQNRNGLGVIWIEHDLDLVTTHADRVVVLHHGQVIHDDDLSEPEQRAAAIEAYMKGGAVRAGGGAGAG
jgi:branched-chain amino acid transport system ATP-binding protein